MLDVYAFLPNTILIFDIYHQLILYNTIQNKIFS